jgi:hypothetical protein
MLAHVYYYAKAYYAALATGVLYLTTVIGPDIQFSDLAHVSLLHWFGFVGSVLGVGAGVAVVTNGDKPVAPEKPAAMEQSPVVSAPLVPAPAAPVSFAATQAKIDAATPEVSAPEVTAPEVAPAATPAQ